MSLGSSSVNNEEVAAVFPSNLKLTKGAALVA